MLGWQELGVGGPQQFHKETHITSEFSASLDCADRWSENGDRARHPNGDHVRRYVCRLFHVCAHRHHTVSAVLVQHTPDRSVAGSRYTKYSSRSWGSPHPFVAILLIGLNEGRSDLGFDGVAVAAETSDAVGFGAPETGPVSACQVCQSLLFGAESSQSEG